MTILNYKIQSRTVFCTQKARDAIRGTINRLRYGRRLRNVISRESELNLRDLSYAHPNLTRAFLKGLASLDRLAVPLEGIVIPRVLGEVQNRELFSRLGSLRSLVRLIDENGVLNLRGEQAGLKLKLGYTDLVPKKRKLRTLEDYKGILDRSKTVFAEDRKQGAAFIFKSLIRVRIDLYVAGEERSALKADGARPKMTPKLQRVKDFLDYLLEHFPFDSVSEGAVVKEGFKKASRRIADLNNTAADRALMVKTPRLKQAFAARIKEEMREARGRRAKVEYRGNGIWTLIKSAYRRSGTGLVLKEKAVIETKTAMILSLIENQIESMRNEREKNRRYLKELDSIEERFPDLWDKLYEIDLDFAAYPSTIKEEAWEKMVGALELARIVSKKDQPLRLAKSLLSLACSDIKLRQQEIRAQMKRMKELIPETEELIGQQLDKMGDSIARDLSQPGILMDERIILRVKNRLGGILGTFFDGEMREDWLRKAKSKATGTKNALSGISEMLAQKKERMSEIITRRNTYLARRDEFISFGGDKEVFREEELQKVNELLRGITELNERIMAALEKAAKYILRMGMNFANRGDNVMCEDAYFDGYRLELHRFRLLGIDQVTVKGSRGESLGAGLREDARAMGLQFEES